MTEEFLILLSNLKGLLEDWNMEVISSEEDFIKKLKKMIVRLVIEIPRQKPPEVSADQLTIPDGEKKE